MNFWEFLWIFLWIYFGFYGFILEYLNIFVWKYEFEYKNELFWIFNIFNDFWDFFKNYFGIFLCVKIWIWIQNNYLWILWIYLKFIRIFYVYIFTLGPSDDASDVVSDVIHVIDAIGVDEPVLDLLLCDKDNSIIGTDGDGGDTFIPDCFEGVLDLEKSSLWRKYGNVSVVRHCGFLFFLLVVAVLLCIVFCDSTSYPKSLSLLLSGLLFCLLVVVFVVFVVLFFYKKILRFLSCEKVYSFLRSENKMKSKIKFKSNSISIEFKSNNILNNMILIWLINNVLASLFS